MAYMPLNKDEFYLETEKMTKIWDLSQPWGWDTPLWPFPGARSDLNFPRGQYLERFHKRTCTYTGTLHAATHCDAPNHTLHEEEVDRERYGYTLSELRLEVARQLGLRDKSKFACLWVIDFPMYEWSEEENRLMAMHHPFTSPKPEDVPLLDTDPESVRANAYDMVINGIEVGGGSIRIHDSKLQATIFKVLGFTPEQAQDKFGFLMNAFKYGAPPHGGLAFGLDRFVSIFAGLDSIRDCIAFPKNNSGRDVMLDAPGQLDQTQFDELHLRVNLPE